MNKFIACLTSFFSIGFLLYFSCSFPLFTCDCGGGSFSLLSILANEKVYKENYLTGNCNVPSQNFCINYESYPDRKVLEISCLSLGGTITEDIFCTRTNSLGACQLSKTTKVYYKSDSPQNPSVECKDALGGNWVE